MEVVLLSRLLFSLTIGFHILFPVLTIGLSIFLLTMESLWLASGRELYFRHARFWGKLFLLNFTIGVVTGIVMEFQFGLNWAAFSTFSGGFFGNILGYEAALAFAAESAFLALMMFGWKRIPPWIHLCATAMVALAAVVSAFWIMAANSWMQAPAGVALVNGKLVVHSYAAGINNPFLWVSFCHKLLSCLSVGLLVIGGLSAWYLRRGRQTAFFLPSFRLALLSAAIVMPLQILTGDSSALTVARHQPAKTAAMESHWTTNPPGRGAAWSLLAWPRSGGDGNAFSLEIPGLLSLLATHAPTGTVTGFDRLPRDERPPIVPVYYSFRLMLLLGTLFLALTLWTGWLWRRGQLTQENIGRHRRLLACWITCVPLGYVAMEAGWMVREIGRQPWSIYKLQRTAEGVSALGPAPVLGSLILFTLLYGLLFALFLAYAARILRAGPDLTEPLPHDQPRDEQDRAESLHER
jgi:cytochrome d ubiquinol oxidase subunit I